MHGARKRSRQSGHLDKAGQRELLDIMGNRTESAHHLQLCAPLSLSLFHPDPPASWNVPSLPGVPPTHPVDAFPELCRHIPTSPQKSHLESGRLRSGKAIGQYHMFLE